MAMLEVKDLKVYYGMIQAIKGVSFHVNEGEVIALIGANGAGKTTILHTVSGLLAPKEGSVVFEGTDITKIPELAALTDEQLTQLFDNNDARQLIHITYGFILSEKDADGKFVYRDRLYAAWHKYRDEYKKLLIEHIGHHIAQLDSLI